MQKQVCKIINIKKIYFYTAELVMTYTFRPSAFIAAYTFNYIFIAYITNYGYGHCFSRIYCYYVGTHAVMPNMIAFFTSYDIHIIHCYNYI